MLAESIASKPEMQTSWLGVMAGTAGEFPLRRKIDGVGSNVDVAFLLN